MADHGGSRHAKDMATGKEQAMTITGGTALAKDDIEQMRWVEGELLELFIAWSNHFHGAANSPLYRLETEKLPELTGAVCEDQTAWQCARGARAIVKECAPMKMMRPRMRMGVQGKDMVKGAPR